METEIIESQRAGGVGEAATGEGLSEKRRESDLGHPEDAKSAESNLRKAKLRETQETGGSGRSSVRTVEDNTTSSRSEGPVGQVRGNERWRL